MLSLLKHVLSGGTGSVIGVGGKWSGKSSAIVGRDDVVGAVGYGKKFKIPMACCLGQLHPL